MQLVLAVIVIMRAALRNQQPEHAWKEILSPLAARARIRKSIFHEG